MRRGRSQVTYRYLPGMFIDYDDGKCIASIERWDSYEIKEEILDLYLVIDNDEFQTYQIKYKKEEDKEKMRLRKLNISKGKPTIDQLFIHE